MAGYVDGFIIPVPKKNLSEYKKMARKCGKIWKEYGALEYTECIGDDIKKGKFTSFPQSVKLKPSEIVIYAYIFYKSKAARNRINKKVMADPRLKDLFHGNKLPFDGKRLIWGGFKPIIQL